MFRVNLPFCCYHSVVKSRLTLPDPMDCNMPGFSVPHHLPNRLSIGTMKLFNHDKCRVDCILQFLLVLCWRAEGNEDLGLKEGLNWDAASSGPICHPRVSLSR